MLDFSLRSPVASGGGNDLARTHLVTPNQAQAGRDLCRLRAPTLLSWSCAWTTALPTGETATGIVCCGDRN